jgi:NAD(P)-dependent dehydrogenase (short-subunit alcohol dehydrogenase family)
MSNRKKYTLITGASSGIGREISIKLSHKYNLILHGRDLERLEETKRMCNDKNHIIWGCDLDSDMIISDELTDLISSNQIVVSNFIHCAGIVTIMHARNIKSIISNKIMNINFTSAMIITSTLLKKKINQQELKNVIFMSSIWSKFGARGYTLYCASKGALDSAMRALAIELAPVVRVNSVLLGAINTPMSEKTFSDAELLQNISKQYPLGVGQTDDAAFMVEFLLSEESRWMTGQQIVLDGGRSINMSL